MGLTGLKVLCFAVVLSDAFIDKETLEYQNTMAWLWIWTEVIFLVVEQIYSEAFYRFFIETKCQARVDERRLMSYSNHTDI